MNRGIAFLLFVCLALLVVGSINTVLLNQARFIDEMEVHGDEMTYQTRSEAIEGDFIYRLVTDKEHYSEIEQVTIYAELEYIGELDEITISHAASPFYFNIEEKTREIKIPYYMELPLHSTTIKRGVPLRETYSKSYGYGSTDSEEYKAFIRDFSKQGFPTGHYVVKGTADFSVETIDLGKQREYKLQTEISFLVGKVD